MSYTDDVSDEAFEDPYEVEMTDADWESANAAWGEWDRLLNDFPEAETIEVVEDNAEPTA